jgi:pyridoxine kinase
MSKTVLSVQSHVVHGYVGNRAAVFPLQLRGWDVDNLNTVQLSNNTGYGTWKGTKATATEIQDIYDGLKQAGFEYNAFLTGYVPSAEGVQVVEEIGKDIKKRFPKAIWVLDPVMGDDGKLYVSEAVIPIYKDILKQCDVTLVTPNGFEAELLTGIIPDSVENIKKIIKCFHEEYKVPNVIISSVSLPGSSELWAIGSSIDSTPFYFTFPALEGYFTGTGDLFAALTVDRYHKYTVEEPTENPLQHTLQEILSVMYGVLKNTQEFAVSQGVSGLSNRGVPEAMKKLELRIVQSRDVLLNSTAISYTPHRLD